MTTFLSLLINGIAQGAIYALVALGFVIIFKASEILNFAHGALLLFGAYIVARTHESLGFLGACLLGIAATALLAVVLDRGLFSFVRGSTVASVTIMTLGLDLLIYTDIARRIGSDLHVLGHPWGNGVVSVGELTISENRLITIAVAAVVIGLFFVAFRFSNWGVALRATAEDAEAASLMGIRRLRVSASAWALAGALATIAGIFLAGSPAPGLSPSIHTVALAAFPAAILGGLDSTGGALLGGLIIGIAQSMVAGYSDLFSFLGGGAGTMVPYVIMFLILLVRPSGLFGTRELTRV